MKKLLVILLVSPVLASMQAPGTLSASEILKHQHRLDSLRILTAQQQQKTQAHNDAYIQQHPSYLRQHPEVLKAHPEYRTRYAKYLSRKSKK